MRSSNSDNSLETLIGGLGLDDETIAVVRAIAGEASALPSDAVELATTLLDRFGPRPKGWESARLTRARNGLHGWLDAATTGPSRGSAILRQPRTIALTFGGQGADWMLELAELWSASAAAQRVITVGINALQQCFDSLTDADRAPYKHGLDVAEWIATPASRPGAEYLASAPITFPMVFIVQAAQLARMVELGLDRPAFRDRVVASAGHSQGVVAAVYAAETWRHEEPWLRAADYVRLTFFLGLRPHQLCRTPAPSASVLARCQQEGHDAPAPMAAVTGPDTESLQSTLDALGLPIVIGLRSTRYRHVVSGKPQHLEWLRIALEAQEDSARKARAKGRLPGRLARLVWAHLPIGRAYHSPDMVDAAERVKQDLRGMAIRAVDLAFTALDTETSAELSGDDIVEQIIDLCCIKPARWDDNVAVLRTRGVGCILDFGPSDGVMRLTGSNLKGFDVAVLGMTRPDHREALLDVARAPRPRVTPFASHRPGRAADGQVVNRFTRWTGMPPVLLPGMTPTTMDAPIVAAAANAGFMSELAGGGQVTEPILRTRMDELQAALIPGRGIVFNALYLDPYLWRLHFGGDRPLVARLRDEGYPIIGVTVSAGIPPLDEAVALLQTLAAHGIWLNSLKPGTHEQIKSVLAIADATPELTLLVQIEGGKAGGHHSWEDLEDLLDTWYGALRARDNIVLAVGGGVGDEQRAADLISGTWSEHLGRPPMPVDAVFPGTVCMAAEEAATSAAVKDAMCQAKGTDRILTDGAREGGITSGRSGLDAPIYYLDNSAAAAGRLLDSLAGDAEAIAARRDAIIQALDRTAKPYFGDVAGMTWTDVLRRYVTLSAVGLDSAYEDGVWPDKAYRTRFVALLQRAESRLTHVPTRSISDDGSQPWSVLEQFIARYGADDTVAIGDEEARFFLQTCRLAGKPVCFVPVIDQDVRRWFKSDSLWQAQHAGYAADAVLTIPGPAAVAGMRQEPIASILGRFDAAARKAVASAPTVDFEQPEPRLAVDPATGRVFGLPSVRSIISGGAGLDLQLRQADGVLLWDRAAWLDAQRSFYADIFDPGYTLDVEAFRVATDDDGYGQPINTAFALTWRAIFDVLTGPAVGGVDLLSLLHEGNVIETGAAWPPATDGRQQTDAELVAVDRTPTGRRIVVRARLTVDDTLSATVTSTFFVRGEESAVGRLRCGAQTFSLQLDTQAELAFLAERPWVTLSETPSLPCALELDCDQWLDRDGRFEAQGRLVVGGVTIGAVSYVGSGQGEHPVAAACALLAAPDTERVLTTPRELGRKRLVAPKDMRAYADASGDRNAIHLDPAMAGLAGLDGVVVHGMWTASAALHRVARLAAGGDSSRITRADVRFVDMVSPGDELVVEARQTALREGAAIVQLTVRALRDDGPIVLTGTAEIAPARTAWARPVPSGASGVGPGRNGVRAGPGLLSAGDRARQPGRADDPGRDGAASRWAAVSDAIYAGRYGGSCIGASGGAERAGGVYHRRHAVRTQCGRVRRAGRRQRGSAAGADRADCVCAWPDDAHPGRAGCGGALAVGDGRDAPARVRHVGGRGSGPG
ncbi:MAG: fatty acid synthase [Myxococcota bacterium]|jgi:fatty acid synthase